MEGPAIQLVLMVVFGLICAAIASGRGRSTVGWFFIGVVLQCFGIILVLVLPDLRVQEQRERKLVDQNRRLKEQLRKDRLVADERHAAARHRLSVHDVALGIDTDTEPTPGTRPPQRLSPPPLPDEAPPVEPGEAALWMYAEDGKQKGPVDLDTLRWLWTEGRVGPDAFVWTEGMAEWKAIKSVPRLRRSLGA